MDKNPLSQDLDHILTHTRTSWEELRGKQIFITGGTGFFGCWLLESFLWANERLSLGAKAVVLSRHPETFVKKAPHLATHSAIRLHQGDIQSFSFPQGEFSHVIHAATDTNAPQHSLELLDNIVQGTRRTLDFAAACHAKKFLLTSSGAVYGKQPPKISHISEDYPGAPDPLDTGATYGNGKRLAEHLCLLYSTQYAFKVKIARCFAFVGPYLPRNGHFAIGNFIRDALMGGPIRVQGDGTPYRSYLYAADLAIWLWTILFKGMPGRAYNVGSSQEISIAHLAEMVRKTLHCALPVHIAQPNIPGGAPSRYVPDVTLAAKSLNLAEHFDLEQSIQRTARIQS